MQLILSFQDRSITINLFENITVAKWFNHFKEISKHRGINRCVRPDFTAKRGNPDQCVRPDFTAKRGNPDQSWQNIKLTIDKLANLGYQFPIDIPVEFDKNQQTLNYLHRFFTYNILWYHDNVNDPTVNPYDANFKLNGNITFQQWLDILDVINVSVHQLERWATPQANLDFILDTFPLDYLHFIPNRESHTNLESWLDFDEKDSIYNYTYFDYHDQLDHDDTLVLLDGSILGKCVLQSFYEGDDVNARDCTGRLGSFGGFVIDLDQNRRLLYESDRFKRWIHDQHRTIDSLPLELPIGYLKNLSSHKDYLISNRYKFQKVEFVG